MALKCENCTKGIMWGHAVSHAKNRVNRIFKPNLQYTKVKVGAKMVRMRLCTKCIKLARKNEREAREAVQAVAIS